MPEIVIEAPWGGNVGIAIFGLLAVISIGFASMAVTRGRSRWISFALRVASWCLLALLVFRVSLVFGIRQIERRKLAILVDRSQSMTLPEKIGTSRWEHVLDFLKSQEPWARLKNDFDLRFYDFSQEVVPATHETIRTGKSDGKETRLSSGIEDLLQRDSWAGILALTDGVETGSRTDPKRSENRETPVVFLYPEEPSDLRDVAIVSGRAPEVAYLKNKVTMEFEIEARGVPRNDIRLRLWSGDRLLTETMILSSQFQGDLVKVPVVWTPDRVGDQVLLAEVTKFPEEVTYENNEKPFPIRVVRDRTRVLHVAGRPSWDERFLREYLKENPNIDLVSFFILRNPGNNPEAGEKELSLIPFPYQDLFTSELPNFDAVIFQNFNFSRYFSGFYLENLKNYVEKGGSFLMLGGELTYGQGRYAGTPVEETLPVRLRSDAYEFSTAPFQVSSTADSLRHPIFSGLTSWREFSKLPPLYGTHRVAGLQPDSVVLLRAGNDPLLAARQYREGRTVTLLTDSLWKWAFNESAAASRTYRDLLNGIFRWLSNDPSSAYLRIRPVMPLVAGEKGSIEVSVLDHEYRALSGVRPVVKIRARSGEERELSVPMTTREGKARVEMPPLAKGVVEIDVRLPGKEKDGYQIRTMLAVESGTREFDRRGVDRDEMKRWADATGGEILPIRDAARSKFTPFYRKAKYHWVGTSEVRLWDHSVTLILLLGVIGFEWWHRRRYGGA